MNLEFKRDTSLRKKYFTPESFAHPAKMNAQLLLFLVREYTKPGEVILDPMAGSGTLMLACTLGRSVILVELEEKFCKMCRDNWEKVRQMPQLGETMGDCQILQGDSRQLEGLVEKIITSPPYAETIQGSGAEAARKRISEGKYKGLRPDVWTSKGNLAGSTFGDSYSKDPNNIGNLPYGKVENIITSPPYENQIHPTREDAEKVKAIRPADYGEHSQAVSGALYKPSKENIGNLKTTSYLDAMLQVYRSCWAVLKDGGLLILVTKNFIRNRKVIRLDSDTILLCEKAGFHLVERHRRILPAQSFWRILYHRKYPSVDIIDCEDILVFSKGGN